MKDFKRVLEFNAEQHKLYEAVATSEGIRHWWTREVEGRDGVGEVLVMRFPSAGFFAKMKILALEPDRCVEWQCLDAEHPAKLGFRDLRDWRETFIRFDLSGLASGKSRLAFTHQGLGELECYDVCSDNWSFYLNESLRGYLETGMGQPST